MLLIFFPGAPAMLYKPNIDCVQYILFCKILSNSGFPDFITNYFILFCPKKSYTFW